MKNLKYILIALFITTAFIACDDDGGTSLKEFRIGAVPNIEKLSDYDATISYSKLLQGEDFNIGVKMEIAQGDVASADLIAFYTTADGTLYGPVTLSAGISTFPIEATFNKSQIVSAFSELSTPDDIAFGDNLTISVKLNLADGTSIDMLHSDGTRNYGSDIHTTTFYNVKVSYDVVCDYDPSLTTGTYIVYSDDWGYPEAEVTIEADPSDPYKLFIVGLAEGEGLPGNGNKVEINVNSSDFTITGPKTIIADDLSAWGLSYVDYSYTPDSGVYKSCDGAFEISMTINVSIGGWGPQAYFFTRKN